MSKPIDNGGSAFPAGMAATNNANGEPIVFDSQDRCVGGMSLRDWFAGMAMQGWVASGGMQRMCDEGDEYGEAQDRVADYSYDLADAMIDAKRRTEGGAS